MSRKRQLVRNIRMILLGVIMMMVSGCGSDGGTGGPTEAGRADIVLQAYLKPSNPVGGIPNVAEFVPGNQFGFSVAISGDTLAVGAPTENSCAPGINGDQAKGGCSGAGAVYVFIRVNGTWAQQAYVKASNPSGGQVDVGFIDGFGSSVALSSDTLAVGAPGESSCAIGVNGDQTQSGNFGCRLSGAVYVFTRTNGLWAQQAYVKASTNIGPFSQFGQSLALTGDTLAVGASSGGGVYVFTRAAGVWSQQANIKAPNNAPGFGTSVALSSETMTVGSGDSSCATGINGNQADTGCPGSGAVYVFTRIAGVWSQQAYIKASNPDVDTGNGGDRFGSSVALAGETLAVQGAGAVYVFTRTNGIWAQQAYVKPSNTGQNFGSLGQSLALNGDTLAVGGAGDSSCATGINGNQADTGCERAGAVYVFKRAAGVWSQHFYLKASNTDTEDRFGGTVALSSETLVVGAARESSCAAGINGNQADNNCYAAGAVYVYGGQ